MKALILCVLVILAPALAHSGQGMGPGPGLGGTGKVTLTYGYIAGAQSFTLPAYAYVDAAKTTPGATISCSGGGGSKTSGGSTGVSADLVVSSTLTGILGAQIDMVVGQGGRFTGATSDGYAGGVNGSGGGTRVSVSGVDKMTCKGGTSGSGWAGGGTNSGGTVTANGGAAGSGAASTDGSNGYVVIEYYLSSLHSDAFIGTDGTALSAHDPNWVSVDAGHMVSGLALYGNTARSAAGAWGGAIYNASSSNISQISVQPVSASVLKGPCVRAGGTNGTGYCIDLGSKVGSNYTRLNLRKNGVLLTYATVAAPVSSAYTLRVEASGTAPAIIDCYMDGSLAISRTDSSSPLTGGHPGFIVESNGSIEDTAVDNWSDYAN